MISSFIFICLYIILHKVQPSKSSSHFLSLHMFRDDSVGNGKRKRENRMKTCSLSLCSYCFSIACNLKVFSPRWNGNIRRCGFDRVDVVLLVEVYHCGCRLGGLFCSSFPWCNIETTSCRLMIKM